MNRFTTIDVDGLADAIRSRLIPFAWQCSCKGKDPGCAEVMSNATEQARYYAIQDALRVMRQLLTDD